VLFILLGNYIIFKKITVNKVSNKETWKKDESATFEGWDFSYTKNRVKQSYPDFDYIEKAKRLIKDKIILDMGTGGGELFSEIAPIAKKAYATETYKPNIEIAKKNLKKFGVEVFGIHSQNKLPFEDRFFDVVLNKHEYFNSSEVFRVLKKGGIFLTQQVGGDDLSDLHDFFDSQSKHPYWNLIFASEKIKKAGFEILEEKNWIGKTEFLDVGALVYTLKAIPWIIDGFSVDTHYNYLKRLQKKLDGGKKLIFTRTRFLIMARK